MGALNIAFREVMGDAAMAVATIAGSIDANTVGAFQKELEGARQGGRIRLILDLSDVKYVNSTGLGSLVKEQDLFKTTGGGIVLLKVPAKVKIVVEMLGLHTFFDMCDSMQEAIESLMGQGDGAPAAEAAGDAVPTTKTQRLKMPASGSARTTAAKPSARTPSKKRAATPSSRAPSKASSRAAAAMAPSASPEGTVTCSVCRATLELPEAGSYQCPRCSTMMKIDKDRVATFFAPEEPVPIQMTLLATPECADGLFEFVGVVAKKLSFGGTAVRDFQRSVMEVCDKIRTEVYGDSADSPETFQVMISVQEKKIDLTFTDHGKSLGDGRPDKAAVVLRGARSGVDTLDVQPHPNGGNIITIAKSF